MDRKIITGLLMMMYATAFAGVNKPVQGVRPPLVRFTENKGQWDSRALYKTGIPGGEVLLEKDAFYYFLYSSSDLEHTHTHPAPQAALTIHAHAVRAEFVGANPGAGIAGRAMYTDYANYYQGNDPAKWAGGAKIFGAVAYKDIYAGTDLLVYTVNEQMKYDWVLAPGANPANIKVKYTGADGLSLGKGVLYISTSVGDVMEQAPYAYQEINGVKKEVRCEFVLKGKELSFALPDGYDKSYVLVIDPTVAFSTYTGATMDNWGYTATYDEDGNMYLGGFVRPLPSGNFYPTSPGAFQLSFGGGNSSEGILFPCDMGITKFNANGTQLLYSTFIGGVGNETPHSLVVDVQGNLIIYGVSYSNNYPVTGNAYDNTYNGNGDIVVTVLNAGGTALLGSTYVGGTGTDGINFNAQEFTKGRLKRNYGDQNRGEINVDAAGGIYVASCTQSSNYPVTAGALQPLFGGIQDGCAFKLNADCSQLIWSTFIGGTSDDACYSLDLGANGTLYVAGGTMSSDFPATTGTVHSTYQGGVFDGFVARINATGTQLLASSYIGTTGDDQIYLVKLDGAGNVYFVGQTTGAYPIQNVVYSNTNSGQFITKLNPQLSAIIYSTRFGNGNGRPNISPTAFLVDTCENVYVAGWGTNSGAFASFGIDDMTTMPLTSDALKSNTDGTDFYFIVLSKNAQELLYGSYFGGNPSSTGNAIEHVDGGTSRFDKRGIIYQAMCAGCGGNSSTPTTPGVWSPTNASGNCNELGLKLEFNLSGTSVDLDAFPRATGCVPLTVQFQGTINNAAEFTWYFGDGATSQVQNPQHTYVDTGKYIVMLVGIDSNSCNISDTAYIDVIVRDDSISANFSPGIEIDCDSNKIFITSSNFATTTYLWDMGDGTNYTNDTVTHYYAATGNYNIGLIVTDSTKCSLADTFSTSVFISTNVKAAFTLSDSVGCIPLQVEFEVPYRNGSSYSWNFGDGTTSTDTAVTHTYTQQGAYPMQLVVTDPNSCNISDTAFANIVTKDSFANAEFTFSRTFFGCDSVRVTVVSTYQGEDAQLWIFGDGFTSTADSVTHTYVDSGLYIIKHIVNHAIMVCRPIDTFERVISLGRLNIDVEIPDTIGCVPFTITAIGKSILLTTDYLWNFGDGTTGTGDTVTHTYTTVGSYVVSAYGLDTNACVFYDTALAYINVINDSTIAAFNATVLNSCDSNLVVQLFNQSINAVEYSWDFGDGNTSTGVDTTYRYILPGTYTITLTAIDTSRCNPIDTAIFTVTLLPNSYVNFDAPNVCVGTATQFTNTSNPTAQFSWNFGDGDTSSQYAPSHIYAAPGQYTVSLTIIDSGTCDITSSISKQVQVFVQPLAGFTVANDTFKFETPVEFINTSTNYEHLTWDFGDGLNAVDEELPIHIYGIIYQVQVCLTAYNEACADTTCKEIFISFDALIGVPNAFSPNGDGINDVIKIEGKGITQLEFRVYNRWGEKVFETSDKRVGWDGYYKGVLQEMEAYTYSVQATFINGQSKALKGNITLLR